MQIPLVNQQTSPKGKVNSDPKFWGGNKSLYIVQLENGNVKTFLLIFIKDTK